MKKLVWILLAVIMSSYTACHWDYHLSNYLFKKYCAEEGRTGLFIYEKVALSDEYFMPFPKDKDPRDLDRRFIVGENMMINKRRLERDYTLGKHKDIRPLTSIGPINYHETKVYRKSDKKLLGKAVSLANRKGWWLGEVSFLGHPSSDTCPAGYDKKGLSYAGILHNNLIKTIFYKH